MSLTISARLLRPFGAVLVDEGIGLETVLSQARIPRALYDDHDARMDFATLSRFLGVATELTKRPVLGLRAARRHDLAQFHMLEYLAASSESIDTALEGLMRHQHLITHATVFRLERHPRGRLLRYHPPRDVHRHLHEYVIGSLMLSSRRAASVEARESHLEAWFSYPEPPDAEAYRTFFPGPVLFDAEASGLLIRQQFLRLPMKRANARVRQLLDQELAEEREQIASETSLTSKVETLLTNSLTGTPMDLPELARQLHMSHATLKRKLAQEGETYTSVLSRVRCRMAVGLLENPGLSIGEVAYRAGYTDVSAFHRAFKRWTGTTPAQHRNKA